MVLAILAGSAGLVYWQWPVLQSIRTGPVITTITPPVLTNDRPETTPLDGGPYKNVPERGENPLSATPKNVIADDSRPEDLLASARHELSAGDLVLARAHFSEALNVGLPEADTIEARAALRRLGRETIFSATAKPGDPLTEYYTIVPGDSLFKIAKRFDITAELLARINNIRNVNLIQAGRRIKTVKGPFNVRVTKSTHTLDIFIGDTFVDHFSVGLGSDDSTPLGGWVVKDKLKNPTYYPPRGGKIVSADDAENPLGERWIGLQGVKGGAVGQMRIGIHGTIAPESIGQNASMGCVRMLNEDVERLFELVIEQKSTVEITQ